MKLSLFRLHDRIDPGVSKSLHEDLVIHSIQVSVIACSAVFVECNKLASLLEVMKGSYERPWKMKGGNRSKVGLLCYGMIHET